MSSLGVPLQRKSTTTNTFSVPKPKLKEKIKISKPIVTEKGFKPEPTLNEDSFRHILKLINDVGKNFERMPSVYKGKGEEDLRDHILMTLDPNFELGSASGETFNKSGKTDIQLRYDSSVIFIAECKFWSGAGRYYCAVCIFVNPEALAKLGHFPTRSTEKEAWFLSPFRPETQASFKVSKKLNRWYDHGAGKGGNVIDLICQINKSSVREALSFLEQGQTSFSFQQQPPVGTQKDKGLEILHARPIGHYGLVT